MKFLDRLIRGGHQPAASTVDIPAPTGKSGVGRIGTGKPAVDSAELRAALNAANLRLNSPSVPNERYAAIKIEHLRVLVSAAYHAID